MSNFVQLQPEDYQIPFSGGNYFPGHSQIQAKEHRSMVQILPHLLNGVSDDLVHVAATYALAFMERHRKNRCEDITDATLRDIERSIGEFHGWFTNTIAPLLPRGGNTIKYHRLAHVPGVMRRMGRLKEYDAQFFEAGNSREKVLFRTTAGRSAGDQHLEGMVKSQALRLCLAQKSTFDQDASVRSTTTAYMRAADTSEHALPNKRVRLPMAPDAPFLDEATRLRDGIAGDYDRLRMAIHAHLGNTPDSVYVTESAVLAANVPWLQEDAELQSIKASPDFHSRPYYDSVVYKDGDGEEKQYAQLRLIFGYRPTGNRGAETPLVLIRRYRVDRKRQSVVLATYGCTPLTWADEDDDEYMVIPLGFIERRVFIVPDFSPNATDDEFHLCPFKWSRTPREA